MSLNKSIVTGFFWSSGGQILIVLINLITNIVLAKYLKPAEFGQVAIVMFFVSLADVFAKGGLAGGLIRLKEIRAIDYSTVFMFNLIVSISCYILLICTSGLIANFYNDSLLSELLVVAGAVLIINALQLVTIAKLLRDLRVKTRLIYQLIATVCGSLVGIILGFLGFGVWSLISLPIAASVVLTSLLWFYEGIELQLKFSKSSFKKIYPFGVNTTIATLINTAFDNVYNLILGKYFSFSQVGYFYQAKKLQDVPNKVLNSFAQSVMFPALSRLQDNLDTYNRVYKRIITAFTAIIGISTIFVYLYSEIIIKLLFGREWMGSIFYLQLLIIGSFFYMQEQFNRVIFKVFDKTQTILYLEILKKIFQAFTIGVGIFYLDLEILLWGYVLTNILSSFVNYYFSRGMIESRSWAEITAIFKVVITSVVLVFLAKYFNNLLKLDGLRVLISFPIILFLYFIILKFIKVFDLVNDIKDLAEILKKK